MWPNWSLYYYQNINNRLTHTRTSSAIQRNLFTQSFPFCSVRCCSTIFLWLMACLRVKTKSRSHSNDANTKSDGSHIMFEVRRLWLRIFCVLHSQSVTNFRTKFLIPLLFDWVECGEWLNFAKQNTVITEWALFAQHVVLFPCCCASIILSLIDTVRYLYAVRCTHRGLRESNIRFNEIGPQEWSDSKRNYRKSIRDHRNSVGQSAVSWNRFINLKCSAEAAQPAKSMFAFMQIESVFPTCHGFRTRVLHAFFILSTRTMCCCHSTWSFFVSSMHMHMWSAAQVRTMNYSDAREYFCLRRRAYCSVVWRFLVFCSHDSSAYFRYLSHSLSNRFLRFRSVQIKGANNEINLFNLFIFFFFFLFILACPRRHRNWLCRQNGVCVCVCNIFDALLPRWQNM